MRSQAKKRVQFELRILHLVLPINTKLQKSPQIPKKKGWRKRKRWGHGFGIWHRIPFVFRLSALPLFLSYVLVLFLYSYLTFFFGGRNSTNIQFCPSTKHPASFPHRVDNLVYSLCIMLLKFCLQPTGTFQRDFHREFHKKWEIQVDHCH